MPDIQQEAINRHMNRLRGNLFTLIEGCVPVGQQEAVKRLIKAHTQSVWRGLLIDAGYSADYHKEEIAPESGKEEHVSG